MHDAAAASELRYDPNDDDSQPGRGPSAMLRVLIEAAAAASGAQTPVDAFERVCRALAEHGISAIVLASRGAGDALTPLAHRLGDAEIGSTLVLPGLRDAFLRPLVHPMGTHPLFPTLQPAGAPAFAALTAPIRAGAGPARAVICLFAADAGPEHLAAADAFGMLLGATTARIEAEARAREQAARTEHRIRARTAELNALNELSLAMFAVEDEHEAARLTTSAAGRLLPADFVVSLLCVERHHDLVVASRISPLPGVIAALYARLHESFTAVAGSAHADCLDGRVDFIDVARPGHGIIRTLPSLPAPAGDGQPDHEPATLLEAPVLAGGRVTGLVALANLQPANYSAEQVRLLYGVVNQLGASVQQVARRRGVAEQRLGPLLEGLHDGVVLLDPSGRMTGGNTLGRELLAALGFGADAELPPAVTSLTTAARRGAEPVSATLDIAGDPPRTLTAAARLAGDDVALVLRDTTDHDLMHERLLQSEKMASIGRLVSGVAHELNNPLTGIMGFAQLLTLSELPSSARRQVETIHGEAERASKIVQNLLSFARRRRPEKTPVDLNALVGRVLELWEYDVRLKQINVRRKLAPRLPPCLADPHQVQQVLLNLLTNAQQAITLGGRGGVIIIRTAVAGQFVRVTVSDDGPGIPPEHLRRVFDPFFTTKPVGEGTGLGLTICYGIVEEHGGRISVESPPGDGATVSVDLPVARAAASIPPEGQEEEPRRPARSILVVDDEQTIQELLAGILALDGHRVERAGNGEEALAKLAGGGVDAVITDVRMPGMDGKALYQQIRARYPALARRIIVTSGDTVNRETRAFVEVAEVPFLPKPFSVRDVRALVTRVLEGEPV